jgi:DNA repair exonuclease SbcCD ATPase subunit
MDIHRLKILPFAVALVALFTAGVWQQQRTKRLKADLETANAQLKQVAILREENRRLTTELEGLSQRSKADANELPKLRGQAARLRELEQENARLRSDRERLEKTAKNSVAPAEDDEETPERRLQRAKGFFGRDLGMALIRAAQANGGFVPSELRGPLFETVEALSGARDYDIRARQFEVVFAGSLRDLKDANETVLAREKEPVQLADGRWVRLYVMADGSSRYIQAERPEAFAARERDLWPAQAKP